MTNRGTWNFFHFNRKLINFGMNDLSVQLLYKFLGHRFFFLAIIIALHFPSCFSTKLIFAKNIKNKIYIDVCIDHSHYWLTLSWGVFLKSFALTVHLNLSYTVMQAGPVSTCPNTFRWQTYSQWRSAIHTS